MTEPFHCKELGHKICLEISAHLDSNSRSVIKWNVFTTRGACFHQMRCVFPSAIFDLCPLSSRLAYLETLANVFPVVKCGKLV